MSRRTDDLERDLGANLRLRRVAAQFTQSSLATRANVSLGSVKSLEAGKGSTVTTLVKVLRVLDATDLVDRLAPPPKPFSPLERLAAQQRVASRRQGPPRVRKRAG